MCGADAGGDNGGLMRLIRASANQRLSVQIWQWALHEYRMRRRVALQPSTVIYAVIMACGYR